MSKQNTQQHPSTVAAAVDVPRVGAIRNTNDEAPSNAARRLRPQQIRPGAFAVSGPGVDYHDEIDDNDTVQIGDDGVLPVVTSSANNTAFDAVVVTPSRQDSSTLPPLVEASVDTLCSFRDWRVQIASVLFLLVLIIGIVLGVVFGVVLSSRNTSTPAAPMTPMPTTSPTVLTWADSGTIEETDGSADGDVLFSLSPDGTRLAVTLMNATIVQVYQEQNESWTELGDPITVTTVTCLSLTGNRLAIGSAASNATDSIDNVKVFGLEDSVWTPVGDTIDVESWTVVLSHKGTVLAIQSPDFVQVYELWNTWLQRGGIIMMESKRQGPGSEFSSLAMSGDGSRIVVGLKVYKYDQEWNQWVGQELSIDGFPPNTPVSMSANGRFAAIGQHKSFINGLYSGRVRVFQLEEGQWLQLGDDIIGDGQVNGFWGWSHSLSGNGERIAIMNNPRGGQNRAAVFQLEGSRWIRALEDIPFAVSNGTVVISEAGDRVAVRGDGGTVKLFDIVGV